MANVDTTASSSAACRPRLYVHDIPGAYRDSHGDRSVFNAEPFGEKVEARRSCPASRPR